MFLALALTRTLNPDPNHTEVVKLLLDKGASVDGKDEGGRTALMLASWKGHTEVRPTPYPNTNPNPNPNPNPEPKPKPNLRRGHAHLLHALGLGVRLGSGLG